MIRILPGPTDNGDKLTFKDLAKRFMEYIMNKNMVISRYMSDIHVVFDKYDKLSIKGEGKGEKRWDHKA